MSSWAPRAWLRAAFGRRVVAAVGVGCLLAFLGPRAVQATSILTRTFDVTVLGETSAGAPSFAAADPSLSADGSVIAFDSPLAAAGSGLNEVFALNIIDSARTLISADPAGSPANGNSIDPSVSGNGQTVAFASTATNLVTGASTGTGNIYVRTGAAPVTLVSAGIGGAPANGPSSLPSISPNGRYVAFQSDATNLVPGDTNTTGDVFLRDLLTGTTTRVSVAYTGGQADGASGDPAISSTGAYLCFESTANDIVRGDTNRVPDVFLRNMATGGTQRVSVSSTGVQENAGVDAPFHQICSVSASGRDVVFDSDATNLVPGESPQPRSNVFLRDVKAHRTTIVSESNSALEANSDSFAPTITPDGTLVAFESFASDLAPGGGPRENIYVRDLAEGTTTVVDVGPQGQAPSAERVSELLQRPTLSAIGYIAAFESTAASLTGAGAVATHVFVRLMDPPQGYFVHPPPARTRSRTPLVTVGADDPHATLFSCQIDGGPLFTCPPGRFRLPRVSVGHHVLHVRAGGPGMLFDPDRVSARFTVLH
jgi:Tol biopolymer transport system component